MAEAFGALLKALIKARGLSLREFDRRVSTGQGYVAHVCRAAAPPPAGDELNKWLVELELSNEDLGMMIRAADIARARHRKKSRKTWDSLEKRAERAESLLVALFGIATEKGYPIPDSVRQAVEAIRKERGL